MRVTMTRETLGDNRVTLRAGNTYEVRDDLARWLVYFKKAKPATDMPTPEPKARRSPRTTPTIPDPEF